MVHSYLTAQPVRAAAPLIRGGAQGRRSGPQSARGVSPAGSTGGRYSVHSDGGWGHFYAVPSRPEDEASDSIIVGAISICIS